MDAAIGTEPVKPGGKQLPPGRKRAPGGGRKRAPGESYEAARRRKESALADLRQQEVQARAEKLVEADAVRREFEAYNRGVQAAMLAVVSRVRQRLPHLTAADAAVLDEEIRAALTQQAGGEAAG